MGSSPGKTAKGGASNKPLKDDEITNKLKDK